MKFVSLKKLNDALAIKLFDSADWND